MAIQDRNLSVGTKLYARYRGTTYTAEVVEVQALPKGMLPKDALADPDPRLVTELRYRLADGREFGSPSAAGTAVTEKSCNGWAFWTVGDGGETTKPAKTTTKVESGSTITAAPKPAAKRRGRKTQTETPPAGEAPDGDEARDDAPPATEPDEGPVPCAECGETFPSVEAATEHYYATHGKSEEEPTA